jgi:thioredoxin-related protein
MSRPTDCAILTTRHTHGPDKEKGKGKNGGAPAVLQMINQSPAFFLLPFTFFLLPSAAIAQEVQWRTNYSLARKEALDTNRPLLLDFGTEQCFWCRRLDTTTFRDAQLARLLNENFIALKIDAASDVRLTEALRIHSFPTLVIAAADGKILDVTEGYREAAALYDQLRRVLPGLRLDQQDVQVQGRVRHARELLAQAQDDYRRRQYLCCWDRCEELAAGFADLPEGAAGHQLAEKLLNNPEWLEQACDSLSERLSGLCLALADGCIKRKQSQKAARYLERILQISPGTPQAETARLRLNDLQGITLSKD